MVKIRPRDGGWQYDIIFRWPDGTRHRERKQAPVSGKAAAQRWAEERERELLRRGPATLQTIGTSEEVPTLAAFWPRVLTDHYEAERKKASTVESVKSIYKNHFADSLGSKRLTAISDAEIAALKGRLSRHKKKTVNNVLAVLARVLHCAVKWRVLGVVPCSFGFFKVPDDEMQFYEVADYRRLVDAARFHQRVRLMILLAGSAGLRRGELRALRWSDVDFVRRQITIRSAVWGTVESTTKGNRARIVDMTPELHDALKAARGLGDRVLYSLRGEELSNRTIRNWLASAQRRASLEANGGAHILRHTFCSHLAMAGVPALAIQKLAGHRDLKTTMRYMHLSPSNRMQAMETLAKFYKTDGGTTLKVG